MSAMFSLRSATSFCLAFSLFLKEDAVNISDLIDFLRLLVDVSPLFLNGLIDEGETCGAAAADE
jgi:hypothetical protein